MKRRSHGDDKTREHDHKGGHKGKGSREAADQPASGPNAVDQAPGVHQGQSYAGQNSGHPQTERYYHQEAKADAVERHSREEYDDGRGRWDHSSYDAQGREVGPRQPEPVVSIRRACLGCMRMAVRVGLGQFTGNPLAPLRNPPNFDLV